MGTSMTLVFYEATVDMDIHTVTLIILRAIDTLLVLLQVENA